ncbi:MAG: type II toxin-antitoxin system VapC family toxin [Cyanobacteria bacterium P01_G01_bin.19]
MIVLDTHIWIWWVSNSSRLSRNHQKYIRQYSSQGLGISIISCWEVAKLVEKNRLDLSIDVDRWLEKATNYPYVRVLNLNVPIIVQSTQLEGFHNDPADQIIVATAKVYNCPLLTADSKILNYSHVITLS